MIINAKSLASKNQIEMPNISLDRRAKYKIAVRRFFCVLDDHRDDLPTHDLVILSSNLVDRSAENPDQAIVHLDFTRKSKYISYCPTHLTFQSLRLYELEGTSFALSLLDGTPLSFKRFFIQLEILRDETYGWF